MFLDALLAMGLLASAASQLRLAGWPIGPGELCLALWLLLAAMRGLLRQELAGGPVLALLAAFWLVFVAAMCLGTMTAFLVGDLQDAGWVRHDITAYTFVAAFSIVSVLDRRAALRMANVGWMLAAFGTALLLLQIAVAFELASIEGVDAWEWDRMRGFAQNANQLALFCLVLAFLGVHLIESSSSIAARAAGLTTLIVAVVAGRLTKSDAFLLALIIALPLFAALKLRGFVRLPWRRAGLKEAAVWSLILLLPVTAAVTIPLAVANAPEPAHGLHTLLKAGTRDANEESANLRLEIWGSAVKRALDSGLLGLGPGPHLPIPPAILVGRRDTSNRKTEGVHPTAGVAPNYEAHNTALDLLVQGGVLVLLDCLSFAAVAAFMTLRSRRDGLTALLGGLAVFSLFHFTLRQPVWWFAIVFCLVTATSAHRPFPIPGMRR